MEPLYPQNILERKYPILREQREKAEREAVDEKRRASEGLAKVLDEFESEAMLYENEPLDDGLVGLHLNTLA